MLDAVCWFVALWSEPAQHTRINAPPAVFSTYVGPTDDAKAFVDTSSDACSISICGSTGAGLIRILPAGACPLKPSASPWWVADGPKGPDTYHIEQVPPTVQSLLGQPVTDHVTVLDAGSNNSLSLRDKTVKPKIPIWASQGPAATVWKLTDIGGAQRGTALTLGTVKPMDVTTAVSRLVEDGHALRDMKAIAVTESLIVADLGGGTGIARIFTPGAASAISISYPIPPPSSTPVRSLMSISCIALANGIREAQRLILETYQSFPNMKAMDDECA